MRIKDPVAYATLLEEKVYNKRIVRGPDCLVYTGVMPRKHLAILLANGWEMLGQIAGTPFGGTSLITHYTLRKTLTSAAA